ncbi:MAG TPA: DUF3618 domain-containing protein [Mycobacteriales bacterium]|nr:DUF3618 domain-containing protein [Mycobacteriales bacterium]
MSPRDPEQIQREIETSRSQLAGTLDQLTERVSPKRLAGQAKDSAVSWARTPVGMAVAGGVVLLVALGIARRVRNR